MPSERTLARHKAARKEAEYYSYKSVAERLYRLSPEMPAWACTQPMDVTIGKSARRVLKAGWADPIPGFAASMRGEAQDYE